MLSFSAEQTTLLEEYQGWAAMAGLCRFPASFDGGGGRCSGTNTEAVGNRRTVIWFREAEELDSLPASARLYAMLRKMLKSSFPQVATYHRAWLESRKSNGTRAEMQVTGSCALSHKVSWEKTDLGHVNGPHQ